MTDINIEDEEEFVSFDVEAMFPSVPVDLAKDIIMERWDEIKIHAPMDRETFDGILHFCLTSGYYIFDGVVYKQVNGLAIGSSLPPIVAELVLDHVFGLLDLCFGKNDIKFKVKYVDDSLFILKSRYFNDVLKFVNSFHSRLRFTYEKSMTNINFLDMTILRDANNQIKFKHYKKDTYTGRLINSYFNTPSHFKRNTAINILGKWLENSDSSFHNDLIIEFRSLLKKNCYNSSFAESVIKHTLKKKEENNVNNKTRTQSSNINCKIKYFRLPFVNQGSMFLKKQLENLDPSIKIAFGNVNTLKSQNLFSCMKDSIPLQKRSEVIYSIPCCDCKGIYVGETSQYVRNRMYSHKSNVKNKDDNSTALACHVHTKGHEVNFGGVSILAYEKNTMRRKIREAVEIISCKEAINFRKDSEDMYTFYAHLLR